MLVLATLGLLLFLEAQTTYYGLGIYRITVICPDTDYNITTVQVQKVCRTKKTIPINLPKQKKNPFPKRPHPFYSIPTLASNFQIIIAISLLLKTIELKQLANELHVKMLIKRFARKK